MNKLKIDFRNAVASDYNDILKLKEQVHEFHYYNRPDFYSNNDSPLTEKDFEDMLNSQDYLIYVAELEKNICGYAFVKIIDFNGNPLINDHRRFFIEDICIEKSLRKKGIGQMLMKKLETECTSRGIKYMDLTVWNFNSKAYDFYRKMGMKETMIRMEKRME